MPRRQSAAEKKVPIAARVDPGVLNEILAIAEADERTLSFMVERALRRFIEQYHDEKKSKPKPR